MESNISDSTYKGRRYSSGYEGKDYSSFETQVTSGVTSEDFSTRKRRKASLQSSRGGRENIKLVPIKLNDLINVFQTNPQYSGKSPIKISMRESEIDKVIAKQHYNNSANSPHRSGSLRQSIRLSPTSLKHPHEHDYKLRHSYQQEFSSLNEQSSRSEHKLSDQKSQPPLGESQAQVYAMTGIQAYPMIGADRSAFKANKSRRRTPRKRSRKKIAKEIKGNRRKLRSRSRWPLSRSRSRGIRPISRGRSKRRRSRPKKIMRVRSSRTPKKTVVIRRKQRPVSCGRRCYPSNRKQHCAPFPLCDNDCTPTFAPGRSSPRLIEQYTCNCTMCQEKLQFIQPGVCSQRKDTWTNEYAIIPKPQINLIDPCKELDPLIYPRAERPCIRDGRGNPLTDCIGRPLRSPVGKKFLNFTANGSVMDTNLRGNFYTGQPPLCVKCPLPGRSCGVDATHNWWTSCGYPVKANIGPFYNSVLAAEHSQRRY